MYQRYIICSNGREPFYVTFLIIIIKFGSFDTNSKPMQWINHKTYALLCETKILEQDN